MMKRLFDIVASGPGLIVLSPLFLILAIWIIIWEILALIINNAILFASPIDTVKALFGLLSRAEFYKVLTPIGRQADRTPSTGWALSITASITPRTTSSGTTA